MNFAEVGDRIVQIGWLSPRVPNNSGYQGLMVLVTFPMLILFKPVNKMTKSSPPSGSESCQIVFAYTP